MCVLCMYIVYLEFVSENNPWSSERDYHSE